MSRTLQNSVCLARVLAAPAAPTLASTPRTGHFRIFLLPQKRIFLNMLFLLAPISYFCQLVAKQLLGDLLAHLLPGVCIGWTG